MNLMICKETNGSKRDNLVLFPSAHFWQHRLFI